MLFINESYSNFHIHYSKPFAELNCNNITFIFLIKHICQYRPSEIIFQKNKKTDFENAFGSDHYTFRLDEWIFTKDYAEETLNNQFQTKTLKGFGIDSLPKATIAAGAIFHYLGENQHKRLDHITSIARIEEERYVWLDRFTVRNLELLSSANENAKTLSDILDETQTAMGGRMLKRWMVLPLKNKVPIERRLSVVSFLKEHQELSFELSQRLKNIGDLERLISKVAVGKVNSFSLW